MGVLCSTGQRCYAAPHLGGDFKRKRKQQHGNRDPVVPSFFETVFLSWASLFINAREIISSQGSLVWHLCKLSRSKDFCVNPRREFIPQFSIVFL